jgi:hypothetical protein
MFSNIFIFCRDVGGSAGKVLPRPAGVDLLKGLNLLCQAHTAEDILFDPSAFMRSNKASGHYSENTQTNTDDMIDLESRMSQINAEIESVEIALATAEENVSSLSDNKKMNFERLTSLLALHRDLTVELAKVQCVRFSRRRSATRVANTAIMTKRVSFCESRQDDVTPVLSNSLELPTNHIPAAMDENRSVPSNRQSTSHSCAVRSCANFIFFEGTSARCDFFT